MSILTTELIAYCAASMPIDDASTSGGAIDLLNRPVFTQFGANALLSLTSSSASDTQNVTVNGRLASGLIDTETYALTGTTEKMGAKTWERILSITLVSNAIGTVTIKQGAGGTTIGTIPIGERGVRIMFYDSASDPVATKTRYEKLFWKNTNGSLTLTSAAMKLTTDAAAKIRIGCEAAVGGSQSVANRLTLPGSVTFVDDNISQAVPGNALASGSAIGVWVEQALGIGDAPVRSTFTTQLSGSTT
jgi:hypothetical protein